MIGGRVFTTFFVVLFDPYLDRDLERSKYNGKNTYMMQVYIEHIFHNDYSTTYYSYPKDSMNCEIITTSAHLHHLHSIV